MAMDFSTCNKLLCRLRAKMSDTLAETSNVPVKRNVLIGFSGSVATIKAFELIDSLKENYNIKVIFTKSALHFVDIEELKQKFENEEVQTFTDADEWQQWQKRGDPVLHIEVFCVKGLNNIKTCVARAWNFERPLLVAPAMNTLMWQHPLTARHLNTVEEFGVIIVQPQSKVLMCGDVGLGAMAAVAELVSAVDKRLTSEH